MNFLAHLYLSGENVEIRIGNFIGDYIKGSRFEGLPAGVQHGIRLHRSIDSFTDSHPIVKQCANLLREGYGKYSGVIVDVFFDHFLAASWEYYHNDGLKPFTRNFYFQLIQRHGLLPLRVKRFLPFMIQSNRLCSYRTFDGLFRALEIMSSVTSLPQKIAYAKAVLEREYDYFDSCFSEFFAELIQFVEMNYCTGIAAATKNSLTNPGRI